MKIILLFLQSVVVTACTIQKPDWTPVVSLDVKAVAASPVDNSTLWAITTERLESGGYALAQFNATLNEWKRDEDQPNGAHWYFALAVDP